MWTPFLVLSLLIGLAALVWSFVVDISGWAAIPSLAIFLVWLPLVSLAILGVLWGLMASFRWTGIASMIVFCGATQWGLFIGDRGRLSYAFMPGVLILIAAFALSGKTPPGWTPRVMPWLALAGIAFAGSAAIAVLQQRRAMERKAHESQEQRARDDRTLLGQARAAWLLGQEFSSQEDYRDVDFLATGIYRDPFSGGEYRWDASKNRLIVTRALTVVARAGIGNGVLDCHDGACRITWDIDVDQLHYGDRRLRKQIDDWVAELQFNESRKH